MMGGLVSGKVAVVTGGCRGIGKAIALKLAENGAAVVIADIDLGPAPDVIARAEEYGVRALGMFLDVCDVRDIREKCRQITDRLGRIDVWVNNAGISQNRSIEELQVGDWDRVQNVDLRGAFFCSQAAFGVMKAQKGGRIINIASLAGERGGRFAGAHYSAAKAGVITMTKSLALAGGEFGITVNAIAPGLIRTQMAEELGFLGGDTADIPLQRLGEPDDVANAALFLASHLSSYITGTTIDVNGCMFMR
jgi:3-oxoacyl-[acyl-carrier protein] reductase